MPNVPINLFGMLGDIGSDLGGAIGHARQRDTLTGLGSLIQGGDYAGAATKAFASGDLNTGLKLLTLGQQQDELKRQRAADAQVFGLLGGGEPAQSPSVNIQPRASIGASPSTGGGAATPKNLGGLTDILEDELIKQGVPKENARAGAAALAGQVVQESTINPRAVHDGGTGYGIYGARLDRRDKMFDWLSRNGYPRDSLEGQARYMVNEALTDYPRTAQAIRAANGGNLSDVTRVVMEDFERPRAGPGAGLPNRVQAAGAAYRTGGGAPVQVAAADNFTPKMGGQAAPSPGVQVAQAAPQTGGDALEARWQNLMRAAALPNLSDKARAAITAEGNRIKFLIEQRDRQQERDARRNEVPSAVKEYEYARRQGFAGSFEDFKAQSRPQTTVNIDQTGEKEFKKETGKAIAQRFDAISKEGDAARQDLALVSQLGDFSKQFGTGGGAALQGALANWGIKVGPNVGVIEAYQAIVDKLTPQQRIPGSGTTSDRDLVIFKSALPNLIRTPEGNAIVIQTLQSIAQDKLERARIAEMAQTEEISASDAIKQLRALPNPYEAFKAAQKGGAQGMPQAAEPKAAPQGQLKPAPAEILGEAKAALAKRPDKRDAIVKRLQENGYDASGL
jgi:hypothetical protein